MLLGGGETNLIQSSIIDRVFYLKEIRGLSSQTLTVFTAALKHFYDMNDIILNWKKINSFIGEFIRTVKDRAYTREEIEKVLEKCDERKRGYDLIVNFSWPPDWGLTCKITYNYRNQVC